MPQRREQTQKPNSFITPPTWKEKILFVWMCKKSTSFTRPKNTTPQITIKNLHYMSAHILPRQLLTIYISRLYAHVHIMTSIRKCCVSYWSTTHLNKRPKKYKSFLTLSDGRLYLLNDIFWHRHNSKHITTWRFFEWNTTLSCNTSSVIRYHAPFCS